MYRAIDCKTWDDPWFSELDTEHKLLFLYLITNRRSTPCGAFEITQRAMTNETGIERGRLDALLADLSPRVAWFPAHQTLFLRNFYKHQKCNPNFQKGAARAAADFPDDVRALIYATYPELGEPGNGEPPAPPPNNPAAQKPNRPQAPPAQTPPERSPNPTERKNNGHKPSGNGSPTVVLPVETVLDSSEEEQDRTGQSQDRTATHPPTSLSGGSDPDPPGPTPEEPEAGWVGVLEQFLRYEPDRANAEDVLRRRGVPRVRAQILAMQWRRQNRPGEVQHEREYLLSAIEKDLPLPYAVTEQLDREKRQRQAEEAEAEARQRATAEQARRLGRERLEAAWADLPEDEQQDVEREARGRLTADQIVFRRRAAKHPDTWTESPDARNALRELRNTILVERGHVPEVAATEGQQP